MRGTGPIPSDIMIVGEAPGAEEERLEQPFIGASGKLLDSLLSKAGILRSSTFVTNVCRVRPPGNDISEWTSDNKRPPDPTWVHIRGKWVHRNIAAGLEALKREMDEVRPKLVIALGNTPLWALTGNSGISKWRGSRLSPPDTEFTVVPTIHPAAALREESLKPIILMDLRRARAIYEHKQIPRVYQFTIAPSFSETVEFLTRLIHLADSGPDPLLLAGDLETRAGHIACFGIADSPTRAFCIPFLELNEVNPFYWPLDQEAVIVHLCIQLFKHPRVHWVGQNFLYDCQYFHRFFSAYPDRVSDTMIGHHSIFSNMRKGLDFLSSMYAHDHIYWKDEIKEWDPKIGEKQFWTYNCLTTDTPVLMADCTYKPLGEVQIGDTVLAFEEGPSGQRYARRLRQAEVTKTARAFKEVSRYTFDDGTFLDATKEHKVLSTGRIDSQAVFAWRELGDLKLGDRVSSLGKPWKHEATYDSGWIGGLFDGEGTLGVTRAGGNAYPRLSFSQKKGRVLDRGLKLLRERGFKPRISSRASAEYIDINGGLSEQLRLLGVFQPIRLLRNLQIRLEIEGLSGFNGLARPALVKIESLGLREVADITTTQGTFIAGGITVHNCKDACITWEIWHEILATQANAGVSSHFLFQQSLFHPVLRMMNRGIRMDEGLKRQMRFDLQKAAADRQDKLDYVCGHPINPKSPQQLKRLFYEDLKLTGIRSLDGDSLTLNSPALAILASRYPVLRPVFQLIAELRSIGVFLSTFIDADLDSDGRMRCSFSIAGPTTFRFSSSKNAFGSGMNLQNIPVAEKQKVKGGGEYIKLPNVRKLFIPDTGYTFFDMDLDRADMQVVAAEAQLSGDRTLRDVLDKGIDLHCLSAAEIFNIKGIPPDELTETHPNYREHRARITEANRNKTKNGGHATNYGVGDYKLAQTLGISVREASSFRARWFGVFPGIKSWHIRVEESANRRGYVENKFGAKLNILGRFDLPECLAWVPQSTVAGVINRALVAIDAANLRRETSIECQLQVHDSLAGQFRTDRAEDEIATLRRLARVEVPYEETLVIPVGINTSTISWGHCKA